MKTHGENHKTAENRLWSNIKNRCLNEKDPRYKHYGGRGISICERWRDSYPNFLADVGRRPSPDMQLDRINNDGNYEPGNVRWATRVQQCRNKTDNRWLTLNGETKTLAEWVQIYQTTKRRVTHRLEFGWSVEDALRTPPLPVGTHRQVA